jgi:hypothetical protein
MQAVRASQGRVREAPTLRVKALAAQQVPLGVRAMLEVKQVRRAKRALLALQVLSCG